MSRRSLLVVPAALVALALPTASALAGEDDGGDAQIRVKQGCVHGAKQAKVKVFGDDVDSVNFVVDGDEVATLSEPNAGGGFRMTMNCSELTFGAHRGRAVVAFDDDDEDTTLRFQLTRSRAGSPRFAG